MGKRNETFLISRCIGKETSLSHAFLYNLGRVLSYTGIGFVLGLIGSFAGGGAASGIPVVLHGMLKLLAGCTLYLLDGDDAWDDHSNNCNVRDRFINEINT